MNYNDVIMILDESALVRECRNSNNHNIISYFNYSNETITVTVDEASFSINHLCLLGDDAVSLFVPDTDGFQEFDISLISSLTVN